MADFTAYRLLARRSVHNTLAAPADYRDGLRKGAVTLHVRHRFRTDLTGQMQNQGGAEQFDTVDRLVFDREELDSLKVTLRPNGRVTFGNFLGAGKPVTFRLDDSLPPDGPLAVVWTVALEEAGEG